MSFEQVVARHRPAISRLARHFEVSPEARRDLEQDILVALWRALATFRGESSEKTFVLRVAHNVAVTHVARAVRARTLTADAPVPTNAPPSPDEQADARALLERVEVRLRAMDIGSRQLVLLALEGCTTAEIADVTGLSQTNVTTRLSRLRRALTQDEQDEQHEQRERHEEVRR